MKQFADFHLKSTTQRLLELEGFSEPTAIQEAVIPAAMKGKDIIGISETGTGKTHAFLIPLMEKIKPESSQVQAVVTAPTRELAAQIYQRARRMSEADPRIRVRLITGGMDRDKMADSFRLQPHLVIGTPGRIRDCFLQQEVLRVDTASVLVVDEADMTLEFGFLEDVDAIASRMGSRLQMMAFSATIPQGLRPFLKKYMQAPQTIKVEQETKMNPRIEHVLVPCRHRSYAEMLLQILPGFMPYVCLIFANTRTEASAAAAELRQAGVRVIELHGGLEPRQRRQAMKQLDNAEHTYIVATDIAARGIDIDGITHVVSLGLPSELDFYIHRAGRTGRAGREGTCFLLVREEDLRAVQQLKERGVHFESRTFKNGQWQTLKTSQRPHRSQSDQQQRGIAAMLKGRKERVKPGYKKKRAALVKEIHRKQRRAMIQQQIQAQRKERYKAQQRLKRQEQSHG